MGAAGRLVLGGAILGLFCSAFPELSVARAENGQSSRSCDPPPCTCDDYGRLTCDCNGQETDLIVSAEGEGAVSAHTIRISISNCPRVVIKNSSLSLMKGLRSVDLREIGNLSLTRQSFRLSRGALRARISIKNTRMEKLPSFAFHGDVESMSFENATIDRISAFAFANLADTDSLRLSDCRIGRIEEQAFKKFDVNYLHVIGGSLGGPEVPSRSVNDIEVKTSFIMDGVRMGIVRSSAFVVRKPKTVAIQNCEIGNVESGGFDVTVRGPVIIKNNNFRSLSMGAFMSIRADPEDRYANAGGGGGGRDSLIDLNFANNSLTYFEEGSVMFDRDSFQPIFENVLINRSCDCSSLKRWKNDMLNYTGLYARLYDGESLKVPISGTRRGGAAALPIEESRDTFSCLDERGDKGGGATSFVDYDSRYCAIGNSIMFFALTIVGLTIVIGTIATTIVWCCRRRRKNKDGKRWMSVPTNAPDVVDSKKNGVLKRGESARGINNVPVDSRITMVVPDGRLYRETEFHVIVEKAEPLTTEL